MAYHDDLTEHAILLSELDLPQAPNEPDSPRQVHLRRAVSAAYYALFHLLTSEAAENWKIERLRGRFARVFQHGTMKNSCGAIKSKHFPSDVGLVPIFDSLKLVADSFIALQQLRHSADYDTSRNWSRTEVWEAIAQAQDAMTEWGTIRNQAMAQDFLIELMGGRGAGNG